MNGSFWVSIGSILTPSIVAIAVVILGARFTYGQAYDGRIWDRKAEAYSAILEALHEMQEWFTRALNDEYLRRDVDESTHKARTAAYQEATKLLRTSLAREVWLLPTAVQDRVVSMNKVLESRQDGWFENVDIGGFELFRAIADITELARGDMASPINNKFGWVRRTKISDR